MIKITVVGAGNGGQALAGYLAMKGFDVSLFNRSRRRIYPIIQTRKIKIEGPAVEGEYKISFATTKIDEAMKGRKLIMIVVPAFAHKELAEKMAPFLEDGQIIVLNPGRTGGALEFYNVLKNKGLKKDVIIAEAQTFIFASRMSNPGVTRIFRIKNAVPVSALPATRNDELAETLLQVMPEFDIVKSIIYTSFNNVAVVFHPATLILNSARVETTAGRFEFYFEGISPSVAKVLEKIDEERCNVMKLFNAEPMTAKGWLNYAYDVEGNTLYEAIRNNEGYRGIYAPTSLNNRYLLEDVPMSLVPTSSFGKEFGVDTPIIDSMINIANVMLDGDFWKIGRTVEDLGLKGKTVDEIIKFVEEGE
ncbi:MAG TPA: NAD/NADP octopine/nopaline dehydrogenase family protein [Defluviitoga sp.]|nr:NAD/NADP octopine/nopaline dehydrogenase family protein [Defluviitoga sp.]HPZ28291.1 NAD/NADP octopine/nopaline dehydrogenase family protein [Defluviitoga sp.]HQD62181.1 NAD/NADP octopine/nopaline dehydrogenase family protein [Defluviitoga sp.]